MSLGSSRNTRVDPAGSCSPTGAFACWEGEPGCLEPGDRFRSLPHRNPSREGRGVERIACATQPFAGPPSTPSSLSGLSQDGICVFRPPRARVESIWCRGQCMVAAIACAVLALAAACDTHGASASASHTASIHDSAVVLSDDAGRSVRLEHPARRIISLVPSVTETLIAIGATSHIIGRTRYDVAPEVAVLPSVGGGIDPSVEAIVGLHPDLVLAWDNDKRQQVPAKLIALGIPVFTLRTEDTADVFRGIANLGSLTGRDSASHALASSLHQQLDDVRRSVAGRKTPTVLYVVFNDPPMTAGPASFIGQLIALAGGRSIFADTEALWPNISMEEIVRRDPDLLIVPTGEFKTNAIERFRDRAGWRDLRAVRTGHVVTVSSDLMSRPGPNIGQAARVLRSAFFPDFAMPADSPSLTGRPIVARKAQ